MHRLTSGHHGSKDAFAAISVAATPSKGREKQMNQGDLKAFQLLLQLAY